MSASLKPSSLEEPHLPGETGVWVFILGDMLMFALLFSVFVYYRSEDVPLFSHSQTTLNQTLGAFHWRFTQHARTWGTSARGFFLWHFCAA
jgi:heme/copper-type cytochrome/quinol oxidase subunit 3